MLVVCHAPTSPSIARGSRVRQRPVCRSLNSYAMPRENLRHSPEPISIVVYRCFSCSHFVPKEDIKVVLSVDRGIPHLEGITKKLVRICLAVAGANFPESRTPLARRGVRRADSIATKTRWVIAEKDPSSLFI